MPNVKGKKFPYTKKGMAAAKKAINEDDSRGFRKRKVNAQRIKDGKPKLKNIDAARAAKQDEQVGRLNQFIKKSQKTKPY